MIAFVLLLSGCDADGLAAPTTPAANARRAEVALVAPADLRTRLFAPSPQGRIVNFWATWCGPCRAEFPHLLAFAAAHPDVEMVLVSLDLASLKDSVVAPFVAEHGLTAFTHVVLDASDPVATLGDIVPGWSDVVPVTLVVDPSGQVRHRFDRAITAEDLAGPSAPPGWWNR